MLGMSGADALIGVVEEGADDEGSGDDGVRRKVGIGVWCVREVAVGRGCSSFELEDGAEEEEEEPVERRRACRSLR
jgi:hypothetical protein